MDDLKFKCGGGILGIQINILSETQNQMNANENQKEKDFENEILGVPNEQPNE